MTPYSGGPIPLLPANWNFQFCTNMPQHPTAEGTSLGFDFPHPPGSVNYVTNHLRRSIDALHSITMTGEITQVGPVAPVFAASDPSDAPPCFFRMYLQKQGDGGTAQFENYRWWCMSLQVPLAVGPFSVTVPLDPAIWTNVYGHVASGHPLAWHNALKNIANIGFTCGGVSFAGHGARITDGQAHFRWDRFSVD